LAVGGDPVESDAIGQSIASTSAATNDDNSTKPEFRNLNFRLNVFKKTTTTTASQPSTSKSTDLSKRKPSALDEVMKTKEIQREKQNRKDHWLHKVRQAPLPWPDFRF
jgi:hypothetical protein